MGEGNVTLRIGFPGGGFALDTGYMDVEVAKHTASRKGLADFCIEWESPAMRGVQSLMAEIASTHIPPLVVGEPGVGKEAIAVQVHKMSPRRDGLLRRIDCSAFSVGDLDALLQLAGSDCGPGTTVFLDEIGELDCACQARLVELLEPRTPYPTAEIDRLGSPQRLARSWNWKCVPAASARTCITGSVLSVCDCLRSVGAGRTFQS